MEVDDAAWADILRDGVDDLLRSAVGAVVECVEVEHHYLISGIGEGFLLAWENQTVGRPEKTRLQDSVGEADVGHHLIGRLPERGLVVECVVAYSVSGFHYSVVQMGIASGIVGDHEKCGFCAKFFQRFEKPGGRLRDWTIVESQIYRRFSVVEAKRDVAPEGGKP